MPSSLTHRRILRYPAQMQNLRLLIVLVIVLVGFILLLALRLEAGHGNSVQVSHTVLRDLSATLWVLLQYTNTLETLENLSLHGTGSWRVLGWHVTTVLWATVEFPQSTNTDGLAQIDVAGERGSSHVEPVWVVWSLLFVGTSLDNVNPCWDLDLAWKEMTKGSIRQGSVRCPSDCDLSFPSRRSVQRYCDCD